MEFWHHQAEQQRLLLAGWLDGSHAPRTPQEHLLFLTYQQLSPDHEPHDLVTSFVLARKGDLPLAGLLAEFRALGPRAPLKHRNVNWGPYPSSHRSTLIRVFKTQAEHGDRDSLLALLRAAIEWDLEAGNEVIEALSSLRSRVAEEGDFVGLYQEDGQWHFNALRVYDTFLAPLPEVVQEVEPVPAPAATPAPAARPTRPNESRAWSLRRLKGPGFLTLVQGIDFPPFVVECKEESICRSGSSFYYSTYLPQIGSHHRSYQGGGTFRPIAELRLSDDQRVFCLACRDGSLDFVSTEGTRLGRFDGGNWTCFGLEPKAQRFYLGSKEGLYEFKDGGQLCQLLQMPVVAFCPGPQNARVWIDDEGVVFWNGESVLEIPAGRDFALAPNGSFLLQHDREGAFLEVHSLPDVACRTRISAPTSLCEFGFSRDSDCLVLRLDQGLQLWSLDGRLLLALSQREALGLPPVAKVEFEDRPLHVLARTDRFFDGLSGRGEP